MFLVFVLFIEETLDRTSFNALFGYDLAGIFRFDLHVEGLFREHFDDRSLLTEAEAAGAYNLHALGKLVSLHFPEEVLVDVLGVTGHASGSAADEHVLRKRHFLLLYDVGGRAVVDVILE
jgi:hypothetical protein